MEQRIRQRSCVVLAFLIVCLGLAASSQAQDQDFDWCDGGQREETLWPTYCDNFYYCDTYRYACSLNARTGYFQDFVFDSCPICTGPVSRFLKGLANAADLMVATIVPNASTIRLLRAPTSQAVSDRELTAEQAASLHALSRVSVSTSGAQASGGGSIVPALSADGRFVAFDSSATNLVIGDVNGKRDVFVHDRATRQTTRVSVDSGGTAGNGDSISAAISADGRYVAFLSDATNLVLGDTNGLADVFVHDRQTGQTSRVNLGPAGVQANQASWPDGLVYWYSQGDLANSQVAISSDGRYVAFVSRATNLVPDNPAVVLTGVCIRDRQLNATSCISTPASTSSASGTFRPSLSMSGDGRFVAFATGGRHVAADTNGKRDVYVHDRTTNQTTRVSVSTAGLQGDEASGWPAISGDGRFVVFASDASNLIAGETNGPRRVYLHDRQAGTTIGLGGGRALQPSISADGRFITYSYSSWGTYVYDRQAAAARLISLGPPTGANGASFGAVLSADGQFVAFASAASDLVPGDTNAQDDVFIAPNVPPTMAADRTSLQFGAVTSGLTFVSQTGAQTVRLTQSGIGYLTWGAHSTVPWMEVTPTTGSGSAVLTVTVRRAGVLPPSGTLTGAIQLDLSGSWNTLASIPVTLSLYANGTSAPPRGIVDTPLQGRTGVTGAVPFTGWALDDIEVKQVAICRAAVGAEVAPLDANCGGAAQIILGLATFIDGARTDVADWLRDYPVNTKAGWGFMVLTNMLPAQGNGTYQFFIWAKDRDGRDVLLDTRTMTCSNATATLPFGAIDTPEQGGVASGTSYVNFGWALTPQPKTIPTNGSTISVLVDGVAVGTASYNNFRSDIATLFPGLNNTNGAVGFRALDTTTLTNGTHTIVWVVSDNQGAVEGIGSRYFTVSNGAGALTAASGLMATTTQALEPGTSVARQDLDSRLNVNRTPVLGRRGWDLEAPLRAFTPDASGRVVVRSEEVNRVELQLGTGRHEGYRRTSRGLTSLPIGSHLNAETGMFTWAPGVGFVGAYDFVFVRHEGDDAAVRREVRIVLQPKGSGAVGPQIVIDVPRLQQDVGQPFVLAGWAADLDAAQGTGIATLHAWAYPLAGGPPVFLGTTAYGGARPDVAAVHGEQFEASGFGLQVEGLAPGNYDLAVFAWSTERADFVPARTVRVTVR